MGNTINPSHPSTTDFSSTYQEIKKDQQGVVLEHKHTKQTYLLKEYTHSNQPQYERHRTQLEKQSLPNSQDYMLAVHKVTTHTIQGLCSTVHKIYAIYQYPQVSLLDQIIVRHRQKKPFDEQQLWSIIQSCNSALTNMKQGISLNPKIIFVTADGELKVAHNDMLDLNYRYTYDTNVYYAPEKMDNFNRLDSEAGIVKQAVFSLGMTVLQAALLKKHVQCYDYQRFLFFDDQLEEMLRKVEQEYSNELAEILGMMLSIEPETRPNFSEIDTMLENFWSNQSNEASPARKTINQLGGIIKNLATINSHQKASVPPQAVLPPLPPMPHHSSGKAIKINKISQSIEYESPQIKRKEIESSKQTNKENLYTDPKLLQMIKKDLEDINKLKQSALKETIKYSFLYPENDSIFKSIQDVKLSAKHEEIQESVREHKAQKQVENQEQEDDAEIPNQFCQEQPKPVIKKQDQLIIGQITDQQGHRYEGQLLNGKKHGTGLLLFDDGAFYQGEFKNDNINGRGILYYNQNKPAYDGMWLDGQFHGTGTLYNEHPQPLSTPFDCKDLDEVQQYWLKYSGQFVEDIKCGEGQLTLTNGQMIEGHFQNDCASGDCLFLGMDGRKIRGRWDQNRLVHIYQQ